MSLYDGLDVDANGNESSKKNPENSASASSIKFLQSQLVLKKAALQQSKLSMKPPSLVPSHIAQRTARPSVSSIPGTSEPTKVDFLHHDPVNVKIENEYDPLYPNEYDQVKAVQKAEAAALAASTRNPFEATFSNTIGIRSQLSLPEMSQSSQGEDPEEDYDGPLKMLGTPSAKRQGAAIPPPSFQSEGGSSDGIFKAAKIMAKFGYKEGQGLGRQEQGMSTALQVEKTGLRVGKIIHESAAPSQLQSTFMSPPPALPPAKSGPTLVDLLKNQTKVVLLRNMVGPGEVDNDLEPEVREEAKKYGDVVSCIVYEMPGKPEDEAIRIFIEFAKIEQAVKAVVDFNGRFFGGRGVKAGFYNLDRFKKFQLSD